MLHNLYYDEFDIWSRATLLENYYRIVTMTSFTKFFVTLFDFRAATGFDKYF